MRLRGSTKEESHDTAAFPKTENFVENNFDVRIQQRWGKDRIKVFTAITVRLFL